jgi:Plant transposon protein
MSSSVYTSGNIMDEVQEEIDSAMLEVDTSSINHYTDVSFSSDESDEDESEITMMVNSTINTNAVVAEAALLLLEDIYDNKPTKKRGGSLPGKATNMHRDFNDAYHRLLLDYFSGVDSVYNEADFQRRFRINRGVFTRIYETLLGKGKFCQRTDALGKQGIHPLVRMVACLRYLAYGSSFDATDEHLRLAESTCCESIKDFCSLLVEEFGTYYLNRNPTEVEKSIILKCNNKRGFPGMFASWDCSHFKWNKCPIALHGAYKSRYANSKTIVLECVVDCFLYIWGVNFGNAGSLNDINILDKSNIVQSIWSGEFDIKCQQYTIQGRVRDYMYFLVDGIYPKWSIFVNTISNATTDNEKRFSQQQESCRKDVERVFAVLENKFQVLQRAF